MGRELIVEGMAEVAEDDGESRAEIKEAMS